MTIKTLASKGLAKRAIARQLSLNEGTVRYHLRRIAAQASDGRARQVRRAAVHREAIAHWMSAQGEGALNVAALHEWLMREHGYEGSLRSVQRFASEEYPPPPIRARRRIETPPGAQAQVDWAQFPGLILGGRRQMLHAFHMALSHSRHDAEVWMRAEDQLCWLAGHNGAFERLGGIPAVVRVDNKTAVSDVNYLVSSATTILAGAVRRIAAGDPLPMKCRCLTTTVTKSPGNAGERRHGEDLDRSGPARIDRCGPSPISDQHAGREAADSE